MQRKNCARKQKVYRYNGPAIFVAFIGILTSVGFFYVIMNRNKENGSGENQSNENSIPQLITECKNSESSISFQTELMLWIDEYETTDVYMEQQILPSTISGNSFPCRKSFVKILNNTQQLVPKSPGEYIQYGDKGDKKCGFILYDSSKCFLCNHYCLEGENTTRKIITWGDDILSEIENSIFIPSKEFFNFILDVAEAKKIFGKKPSN